MDGRWKNKHKKSALRKPEGGFCYETNTQPSLNTLRVQAVNERSLKLCSRLCAALPRSPKVQGLSPCYRITMQPGALKGISRTVAAAMPVSGLRRLNTTQSES